MDQNNIQLKEIKPFLSGYISKAGILLRRDAVPDDDAVHDIRVLMKKSRAVLKLTAPLIDTALQDKDFLDLKRVGQIMSEWRDTSVHRKTLKVLKREFPSIFAKLAGYEKIGMLTKKPEMMSEAVELRKNNIDEIDGLLNKTRYRIRFHQIQKIDPVSLLRQLELSYNIVCNIYLECRIMPRPEKIHEFRKRSKDFLYQLFFFRPLNPPVIKSLEKKLDTMTMYLGNYNDLSQLVIALDYNNRDQATLPALNELIIRIRDRQDAYLKKVWSTAYNCFCPGTKLVKLLGFKLLVI